MPHQDPFKDRRAGLAPGEVPADEGYDVYYVHDATYVIMPYVYIYIIYIYIDIHCMLYT